ncbi:hypothetical protein [Mycolicibacterium hodleri]|uniref:Uncharacterized protein n=1 Tax=Mycolicibacterium hodleri TaxID=49897 RepID=A0A502EFV1_9MYCO|nr:hypothetical protein [Mycolicibacterium hodleri]TPG35211.1 hypothetical protein EAH80_10700 [Mycolicibacterium hodleri]
MNTSLTTLRRLTTVALGAGAVAIGALAMGAPANADTFQHSCETNPGAYAAGAVKGVFSTQRSGLDLEQICKVYDANGKHLGTMYSPIYGFFKPVRQIPTAPVLSNR